MLNRHTITSAMASLLLLGATIAGAGDAPTLLKAKDLRWTGVAEPAGAKQAPLWGDNGSGDSAVLVSWQFNSKLADVVRARDTHIFVLTGTFTLEIGGRNTEFGPGGFAIIPRDTKHTMGCEAAGECTFLLHLSQPPAPAAEISSR
jgi:mannose-6-phosphate isomerase-like protein (cupin superfamily)